MASNKDQQRAVSMERMCVTCASSLVQDSPSQACAWPSAVQMPCLPNSWAARYFSSESADKVHPSGLTRLPALSLFRPSSEVHERACVCLLSVARPAGHIRRRQEPELCCGIWRPGGSVEGDRGARRAVFGEQRHEQLHRAGQGCGWERAGRGVGTWQPILPDACR